jgi:hypothetical protein
MIPESLVRPGWKSRGQVGPVVVGDHQLAIDERHSIFGGLVGLSWGLTGSRPELENHPL